MEEERIILTVKATIDSRDLGLKKLMREYGEFKRTYLNKVKDALEPVVKDRGIEVYSQQKWNVRTKMIQYLKNLPLHPMPFHNQSYWIEKKGRLFLIYLKTSQGETVCNLLVPEKYQYVVEQATGKENTMRGQAELIEDNKYGRMNVHITLRLPKPKTYETEEWVGVDVGWRALALSALVSENHISEITFHSRDYKTRIIQLKYLLKQYQRAGRSWKKWDFRLKNMIKDAVGKIAKEIVEKAKKNHVGIALENLTFRSHTKRWLIPRYKLQVAIKNLCIREGIPLIIVNPRYTSITCSRCGYLDKLNREGKNFKCMKCGYSLDADLNAAVNIGRAAISTGYTPMDKTSKLHAEEGGEFATPTSPPWPQGVLADGERVNQEQSVKILKSTPR